MATTISTPATPATYGEAAIAPAGTEARSAVSWSAVFAGAAIASAATLLLLGFGAGLGLGMVSPFGPGESSATGIGLTAALALIVVMAVSYYCGGYIAGRMRTKAGTYNRDEANFRDGVHGLAVWAVGTIVGLTLLTSAASSVISGGARLAGSAVSTAANVAGSVASGAANVVGTVASGAANAVGSAVNAADGTSLDPSAYITDKLFRTGAPDANASAAQIRDEVGRIAANAVRTGSLPEADKTYLVNLVANRTGIAPAEAEQRVNALVTEAKGAADQAKKTLADARAAAERTAAEAAQTAKEAANTATTYASRAALFAAFANLIGLFAAWYASVLGGRHRNLA